MDTATVGAMVRGALEPILLPVGFSRGQQGSDLAGRVQVIFCAAHDQLSDHYPLLPQANAQARGKGACIDMVLDSTGGTLDTVDFEEESLPETLRLLGLETDAEAVATAVGRPLEEALPVLVAALSRLFKGNGTPATTPRTP